MALVTCLPPCVPLSLGPLDFPAANLGLPFSLFISSWIFTTLLTSTSSIHNYKTAFIKLPLGAVLSQWRHQASFRSSWP